MDTLKGTDYNCINKNFLCQFIYPFLNHNAEITLCTEVIYCKTLLSTVHFLSKKDCECNHTMIDAIKMDITFLLLLEFCFQLCFCVVTKKSEITATFKDVDDQVQMLGRIDQPIQLQILMYR